MHCPINVFWCHRLWQTKVQWYRSSKCYSAMPVYFNAIVCSFKSGTTMPHLHAPFHCCDGFNRKRETGAIVASWQPLFQEGKYLTHYQFPIYVSVISLEYMFPAPILFFLRDCTGSKSHHCVSRVRIATGAYNMYFERSLFVFLNTRCYVIDSALIPSA